MELDPWHVIGLLSTALGGMASWTWMAEVKHREAHATKLLDHSDRLTRLEANMLTRDQLKAELREVEHRIMEAITGMDRHQTAQTARVEAIAIKAHERADELRRDISGA